MKRICIAAALAAGALAMAQTPPAPKKAAAPPVVKERDFMSELSSQVSINTDVSTPDNLAWNPNKSTAPIDPPAGMVLSSPDSFAEATIPPPLKTRETVVLDLDNLSVNLPPDTVLPNIKSVTQAAVEIAPFTATNLSAAPVSTLGATSYTNLLPEFRMIFAGGMICEVTNDNFRPVCWDEAFKPTSDEAQKVWNLNPASAFRIAYRTGMPYLGPVVGTDINTQFFTLWGFTAMPKTILIRPIKSQNVVTHLVLCVSEGLQKNHLLLNEGDRIARLFSDMMQQKKAAA
ncbi:MAG: hypothetical protein ABSF34_18170 [Verrucomicrobiota bacterium]